MSQRSQFEKIVDEFDAAWLRGEQPALKEFVAKVPKESRSELFKLLLPIDIEYRSKKGETVKAEDYKQFGSAAIELAGSYLPAVEDPGIEGRTIAPISPVNASLPVGQNSRQIGPYKLLQKIGEGGMGTVWMAQQEKPVRRRVALKLIKPELATKEVIVRFEAERQALAMMDHPNIAMVLDAGTSDSGAPYFVMELIKGTPLNEYCDQQELKIESRLQIMVDVCEAIQHAHQKGILHRDLKPANVLISKVNGKPVPKVIDFGLAKATEHTNRLTEKTMFTEFGQVVGTLQYMSPEQAEMDSLDIDTRTDIYSLGVMLYELLAGSTPLDQETLGKNALLQVLEMIREKEPPRPSTRLSSSKNTSQDISRRRKIASSKLQSILKGELDWVVMKAIEKNRKRRYDSAAGFAEDIRRFLANEPVTARPPSTGYRVQKFVQKNKGLVASLATISAMLVATVFASTLLTIKANSARDEAAAQRTIAENKTKEVAEQRDRARQLEGEANFQLAHVRWNENRVGDARRLLNKIPIEDRYFDWHYSQRHFLGSDLTFFGHQASVMCVVFSPNGRRIVSADADGTIKFWDAARGHELQSFGGHTKSVDSVSFSPNGRQIATGSRDSTIKLWDATTGREVLSLSNELKLSESMRNVSFSPNGQEIVSSSGNEIRLWDASTGDIIRTLSGHKGRVNNVVFSEDGLQIISGGQDGIRVWDTKAGSKSANIFSQSLSVDSLVVSPDRRRIFAGGFDRKQSGSRQDVLKVWDTKTRKELFALEDIMKGFRGIFMSPDGLRFATIGEDMIKVLDAETGQEVHTFTGHTSSMNSLAFSPDGQRIVSASDDKTLKMWDAKTGIPDLPKLKGHSAPVFDVAFSPKAQWLVSGSDDNTIKLWNVMDAQNPRVLSGHIAGVDCVTFSADGERIASGSRDKLLKVWDRKTGKELMSLKGHVSGIWSVAFSPDDQLIASGSSDKTVKLWDAKTGKERLTLRGHKGGIERCVFSPDGSQTASASRDGTVKTWDLKSGKNLLTLVHEGEVYSVAFSPDGQRMVSGSDDIVNVWDAKSGEELMKLSGHAGEVWAVAFSPDGQRIVSGCEDKKIKFWDARTGQETLTLEGQDSLISAIAFSNDGGLLASSSADSTIKLRDGTKAQELIVLQGHKSDVLGVAISDDGQRIYSKDKDKEMAWSLTTFEPIEIEDWPEIIELKNTSSNERWSVSSMGSEVLLVDLEFKNTPREKSFRKSKARFDPLWHDTQAIVATTSQNWYAAMFHHSLLAKRDPAFADKLRQSYDRLQAQFRLEKRDVTPNIKRMLVEPE